MADPKAKIIEGITVEVSQPYDEGHTLTAIEARQLNQVRAENIGNNLRKQIKELVAAGKENEVQALVSDYDKEYTFAMPSTGRRLDPVERKAQKLAKDAIKLHLQKQGRKLTDVPSGMTEEEWKAKLQENIEALAMQDDVLKMAKKAVEAERKNSDALLNAVDSLKAA